MLEIILSFLDNLKVLLIILTALLVIFLIPFTTIVLDRTSHSNDAKEAKKKIKIVLLMIVIFGLISCIPSIDDLWKVRIGLIKYQLSSKENIESGMQTIERIGHKLECQYLGCKEDKK